MLALNYRTQGQGDAVVLLHGLCGNLDNLNQLANSLKTCYQVVQVDLRNHGHSPWSDEMSYAAMAEDLLALIDKLQLQNVTLLGHSMGGKVAMYFAAHYPHKLKQLIVLDMAPFSYDQSRHHTAMFQALAATLPLEGQPRQQLQALLQQSLPLPVVQFLLKSYQQNRWQFNILALQKQDAALMDWQVQAPCYLPALFVRAADPHYVPDEAISAIQQHFPLAQIERIPDTGHNLHAEKPAELWALLQDGWLPCATA